MQIAVIGLGNFGSKLAETLETLGGEVIGIDSNEEIIEGIKDRLSQAVTLDATDERALQAIGMSDVDVAVIAIGNDTQASIMATSLLRQMGVTKIIARAISNLHGKVLIEVGASQVIRIEEQMGEQAAKWIIAPEILQQFSFSSGYSLVEVKPKESFIGKMIKDVGLRENFKLSIAAVIKRSPEVDQEGKSVFRSDIKCPPDPEYIILRDDVLVLVGLDSTIEEFTKEIK